jgi:hypothetical protein
MLLLVLRPLALDLCVCSLVTVQLERLVLCPLVLALVSLGLVCLCRQVPRRPPEDLCLFLLAKVLLLVTLCYLRAQVPLK